MITLNNIAVGNDWKWIFWALFHTLFNLQGHIFLLQGQKVCQKHAYFNA